MQWLSLGGARLDPAGKAGLSRITARMLNRGTDRTGAAQLAATFDSMGARLSPIAGNNTLGLEANVLKEDFGRAFGLFAEMVRRPAFPADQFRTVRQRTLAAIQGRRDNWQSELSYLFRREFYRDHPYASGPLGEIDSVASLTREDVKGFCEDHVVPQRSVLTIFGDIDTASAAAAAREHFGDFERTGSTLPDIPAPADLKEDRTVRERINRGLSAVHIGFPGIRLSNTEDRFPLQVLDAVLSGIGYPGGWLQRDLRGGNRDLVYVVHAFNFMGLEPGYFGIMAASSPRKMDEVVEIIRTDLSRLRGELVGQEELQRAKNMCITMDKLGNQTSSAMARQRGLSELYGLGYRFPDHYEEHIQGVTAEDVRRVARTYLNHSLTLRLGPGAGR
jgi:zinc protease